MSKRTTVLSLLLTLAFAAGAGASHAQPAPAGEAVSDEPGPISVGLKAGVLLPQVATDLGTTWLFELQGGFRVHPHVDVFLTAGYTQPKVSRTTIMDPRVGGSSYDGTQTQRELTVGAGGAYRFLAPASMWNAYAGAAVRLYMLETVTKGDAASNPFGTNTERSTHVGGVIMGGGERRIGPGAAIAEVQFGISSLPHTITGDVTTGAIALALGYRMSF